MHGHFPTDFRVRWVASLLCLHCIVLTVSPQNEIITFSVYTPWTHAPQNNEWPVQISTEECSSTDGGSNYNSSHCKTMLVQWTDSRWTSTGCTQVACVPWEAVAVEGLSRTAKRLPAMRLLPFAAAVWLQQCHNAAAAMPRDARLATCLPVPPTVGCNAPCPHGKLNMRSTKCQIIVSRCHYNIQRRMRDSERVAMQGCVTLHLGLAPGVSNENCSITWLIRHPHRPMPPWHGSAIAFSSHGVGPLVAFAGRVQRLGQIRRNCWCNSSLFCNDEQTLPRQIGEEFAFLSFSHIQIGRPRKYTLSWNTRIQRNLCLVKLLRSSSYVSYF